MVGRCHTLALFRVFLQAKYDISTCEQSSPIPWCFEGAWSMGIWWSLHLRISTVRPCKKDSWNKVSDLSSIHFWKQSATDGTYGSRYWKLQGLAAWFRAKSTTLLEDEIFPFYDSVTVTCSCFPGSVASKVLSCQSNRYSPLGFCFF